MLRPRPIRATASLLVILTLWLSPKAVEASKLILALGDASYLPGETVKGWTGAEVKQELGEREMTEFALIILSNVAYGALPLGVREQLVEYLNKGGSILISGGASAYGSGGYDAAAHILPFEIRAQQDWRAGPFKPVIPVQPDHPILSGVTFASIGTFNDLNPRAGATEIARYAGGGTAAGARFASPLIAERPVGQGTVLGIAFDLGQEARSGWANGARFLQNLLAYLVARSPLEPKPEPTEKADEPGAIPGESEPGKIPGERR